MPRYFFNICNGRTIVTDSVGIELPDLKAAIIEAKQKADDVVGGLLANPQLFIGLHVQVCDEVGSILGRIDLPDTAEFAR